MKSKDEFSNKTHLSLNTNRNLKPFKVLQSKETKSRKDLGNEKTKESLAKTIFSSDAKANKFENIKSSIFQRNLKSKEKAIINISNDKNSKDKQSESKHAKNKSTGNASYSLSSKQNLREIKNEKLASFNLSTKNKTALHFFKHSNKKNAISLKKDVNLEELNAYIPLKRPKKPSTNENWKSFFTKNSNFNTQNHLINPNQQINCNSNNENLNIDNNQNNSFTLLHNEMHINNNVNNNCENKSDNYNSKINKNLNTYLLSRQGNQISDGLNPNFVQGFNSLQSKQSNALIKIQNKANNISMYNHANSNTNLNSNIKNNMPNSKKKFMTNYNSKAKLNYKKSFKSKDKIQNSDYYSNEFNINHTNSTASPNTIAKNYSNFHINNLPSFGIVLNPIENLTDNEYITSTANENKNINFKFNSSNNAPNNNNDFHSASDLQKIENFNSANSLNAISRADSPMANRRIKCFTPLSAADMNNSSYHFKKNKSMQNFFPLAGTDNFMYLNQNFNFNNNNNNIAECGYNNMQIPNYLNIFSPNNKQLSSANSIKSCLMRPKTVNGISNFKFNARINQETYKSIQDVLVTPTSYLPFSRKRDRLLELEKQSYMFQDKVDKELKIAKTREARKIKIKSKNELSNYLMRDYFIGEKSNMVEGSKKRMKMTRDFDHDKEVQKKKKMALLKNEEYKETDQEDLTDSDEREMFEMNEVDNKEKLIKFNSECFNIENKNYEDQINENKEDKQDLNDNNDYFKEGDSGIDTESNFNQSKISNNVNNQSKAKINKSHSSLGSECNQDVKPQKDKIPKKPTFNLGLVQETPANDLNFEEKQDELTTNMKNENLNANGKKRNNLASRKGTSVTIKSNNKNGEIRKESKITNISNRRNSQAPSNLNNSQLEEEQNLSNGKHQNQEDSNPNKQSSIAPEALMAQQSSKSILSKKLNFIKNLPLEKLQELINTKKKKLEEQILEGIKTRSEIKADQILEISLNDYSDLYQDPSDRFNGNNINVDNLNRVIRVRNILKGKHKNDEQKERYKKMDSENKEQINKIIRFKKLGPPSFLKTNFKKETNLKFKMLGGKFFGCQV